MHTRNKKPQPRRLLGHGRIQNRLHVDPLLEEFGRRARGFQRAAGDGGHDGQAGAGAGVYPGGAGLLQEEPAAGLQGGYAVGRLLHFAQRRQRRGGDAGRHADAVQETGGQEFQVFDQRGFAGDVAAAAGQRLAQGTHPDVDVLAVDAEVFADAVAARAHDAQGVGFVDHEEGAVALLDLDEARQVGVVAVHAVDAFQHDEDAFELAALVVEDGVERFPVVVGEGQAARAGELDALQDAVVDQFVVQHQVARAEEVADGGDVGGVAADEGDGVVHAVEGGDLGFEFAVHGAFAGNQAAGGHRGAVAVDRGLGRGDHVRVAGHVQVVVAGVVDVAVAADPGGGAGGAFMQFEEGVLDAEAAGAVVDDAQLLVAGVEMEAVVFLGDLGFLFRGARQRLAGGRGGLAQLALQRLLDEFVFDAGGKAGQLFYGTQVLPTGSCVAWEGCRSA